MPFSMNPWDIQSQVGGGMDYFSPTNYMAPQAPAADPGILGGMGNFFGSTFGSPSLSEFGGGTGGALQMAGAGSVLDDMFTYRDPEQSALAGGLQGALSGLAAGSMFGNPMAMGAGALLGGASGAK